MNQNAYNTSPWPVALESGAPRVSVAPFRVPLHVRMGQARGPYQVRSHSRAYPESGDFLGDIAKGAAITALYDPQTKQALKVMVIGILQDPEVTAAVGQAAQNPAFQKALDPFIMRAALFLGGAVALGVVLGFAVGRKI